ncbi:MAG: outer membrane protein assembly factor BamB family protein, partial [Planctomycetota bacterium]
MRRWNKGFFLSLLWTVFLASHGGGWAQGEEGGDWTRWRGPKGNGISEDADWDPLALNGGPKVAWIQHLGRGASSVAVRGGFVYTQGCSGGGAKATEAAVYCLKEETGETVWTHRYPADTTLRDSVNSTPVVDEGHVYVLSNGGVLYCLEEEKGAVKWEVNLITAFKAKAPQWGFAGCPCIEGDLLILNACKSGIALNKKTGKRVWVSGGGMGGYATPVVVEKGKKKY